MCHGGSDGQIVFVATAERNERLVMTMDPKAAGTTKVGPGTGETCTNGCRGNLVTITMYVRGDAVTMTSCSTCDRRTWSRSGERVELRSLLDEIKAAQPLRKAS